MPTPNPRREPPPFRPVQVGRTEERGPLLRRLTLTGPGIEGLEAPLPAASVRLLLPSIPSGPIVLPVWNGNEFLLADGRRPVIRTLTPLRLDAGRNELDVEVVLHGEAPLSRWARHAGAGTPAAASGTGRGYEVDPAVRSYLLAGDESAVPAISTLLGALPVGAEVRVLVEVRSGDGIVELPEHPGATVQWCELGTGGRPGDALVAAVRATPLDATDEGLRVWVAGEAAAVQQIRKHLFDQIGLPRSQASVRGYWKHGRAGAGDVS